TSDVTYHLTTKDHVNVYAKKNLGSEQQSIEYVQFKDGELKDFYHNMLQNSKNPKDAFEKLRKQKETLFKHVDEKEQYHLPEISLDKENILHISPSNNKKELKLTDILEAYKVNKNDSVIFNVVAVNEDSFQIDLQVKQAKGS